MSKSIRYVSASDTFEVLRTLDQALNGECILFVTAASQNSQPVNKEFTGELYPETAVIVESSGSTGIPKQIQLSAASLLYSAEKSLEVIGGPGQWLLSLPTNFIAGLQVLTRSIVSDSQPVMINTQLPFTADSFVRGASLMEGDRKYTSLVPTQLARLAQAAMQDAFTFSMLRKFDAILLGGQKPDWSVVQQMRSMGINLVLSYGMTETSGGCVFDGHPLPGVNVELEAGRIRISGPVLAQGLGSSFLTNDLGVWQDGKLEVLGRADRVITSGGKKLSLDRVEQVLESTVGIEQIAAVAVENPEWGERVGIAYVGSPEVEITRVLENAIGPEAKPFQIMNFKELPLLSSGKPDLVRIRELLTASI